MKPSWFRNELLVFCTDKLFQVFDIPYEANEIRFCVHKRPTKSTLSVTIPPRSLSGDWLVSGNVIIEDTGRVFMIVTHNDLYLVHNGFAGKTVHVSCEWR